MKLTESEAAKLVGKLATRNSSPKLTKGQRQQLVKDYLSDPGITMTEVARKYGVSPPSAHYLIHKAIKDNAK